MKRQGWLIAMMLAGTVGVAGAQEVKPTDRKPKPKPKPAPTAPSRPPPTPPTPPPETPAEPPGPESVPATDPADQRCVAAGGLWTGDECDMRGPGCVAKGGTWNPEQAVCLGKVEVSCPEGTVLKGDACVSSPVRAPDCEGEVTSDGRCIPKSRPAPVLVVSPVQESGSSLLRTTTIVAGGVLLGAGAVTGIMAFSKKGNWVDACDDDKRCLVSAEEEYDAAKLYANVSTAAFVAGGALMATGLFLLPSGSSPDEPERPSVGMAPLPGGGFVSAHWWY